MTSYSRTNTTTETDTFTIADARFLASRIKIVLSQYRLWGGAISEQYIENLTLEAAILLKAGILGKIIYGFERNDKVIHAVTFTVNSLGQLTSANDEPSSLGTKPDLIGTTFFSFLTKRHNAALNQADLVAINELLPIHRKDGTEPNMTNGSTSIGDSYYRNGYGMTRSVYTSF